MYKLEFRYLDHTYSSTSLGFGAHLQCLGITITTSAKTCLWRQQRGAFVCGNIFTSLCRFPSYPQSIFQSIHCTRGAFTSHFRDHVTWLGISLATTSLTSFTLSYDLVSFRLNDETLPHVKPSSAFWHDFVFPTFLTTISSTSSFPKRHFPTTRCMPSPIMASKNDNREASDRGPPRELPPSSVNGGVSVLNVIFDVISDHFQMRDTDIAPFLRVPKDYELGSEALFAPGTKGIRPDFHIHNNPLPPSLDAPPVLWLQ